MDEVAKRLRLSKSAAYELAQHGLPVIRLGRAVRVTEADLAEFIERRRTA